MREYGLVVQTPAFEDLVALPFMLSSFTFKNTFIEVIEPEWIEGSYFSSGSAGLTNNANMKRAIIDCSKYDFVLFGTSSVVASSNVYSGMRPDSTSTGQMHDMIALRCDKMDSRCYSTGKTDENPFLFVSQAIDNPAPILGIIIDQ